MVQIETRSLISALIAILGVWLLLRNAPDYTSLIFVALTDIENTPVSILWLHGLHLLINAFLGALLIMLRNKLARWLVPIEGKTALPVRSFLAVGVAVVGIYFLAFGSISISQYVVMQQIENVNSPHLFWSGVFAMGVGVALFVGSVGIGRLWAIIAGLRHASV
jgi:hypothetical protein